MAEPVKPLTLQEISELRKKAQQQAGDIAMSGTDWANIALLIVAEQIALANVLAKKPASWEEYFGVKEVPAP